MTTKYRKEKILVKAAGHENDQRDDQGIDADLEIGKRDQARHAL